MWIRDLNLRKFRNYNYENVEFDQGINIFIGNNAQGKTNLLEAVFYLANAQSFKSIRDKDIITFKNNSMTLSGLIRKDSYFKQVLIEVDENDKNIFVNEVKYERNKDLKSMFSVVLFTPDDLTIIKEGPNLRRDLIDDIISSIDHSFKNTKKDFDKVLFQRNKLLKSPKNSYFNEQLGAFDKTITKLGYKIYKTRKKFIEIIDKFSKEYHLKLTDGEEVLSINYNPSISADSKEEYYEKFMKSHDADLYSKSTQSGIQRDEIDIKVNDLLLKTFGSQGQQRSAILNIKLAQVRLIKEVTGDNSVILFDDVFSELDEKRSHFLLENLKGYQTIITATNTKSLDMVEGSNIRYISNGKITKGII